MLKSLFSIILFGALFLVSCTEINQTVVIDYDEQTELTISSDMSSLLAMAEMVTDSLDDTPAKTLDPNQEINPLSMMDNPDEMPDLLDTIISLSQEPSIDRSKLTDRENEMLDRINFKIDMDKPNGKAIIGINLKYASLEERNEMLVLFAKVMDERENKGKEDNPSASDSPSPEELVSTISTFLDYSVDVKNGIVTVKESTPDDKMMGDEEMDFENMEPAQLAMMEAFMPGGITTRFELPGKVFRVSGVEHKMISESIVEIYYSYISIMKDKKIPGYTIEFEPEVPITDPKVTEVWEPEPQIVTPSKKNNLPPSDAIVLFGGKNANAWQHDDGSPIKWKVGSKEMTVTPGSGQITTKESFGDCQLHLEWKSPKEKDRKGQDKGNSGVYLQGKYEVQILNSYQNRTYANGQAASIYKQYPPLVNAMNPPGEWNVYDIIFHAPKFDADGVQLKKGTITVIHNGVVVQDHIEILGTTEYIGRPKTIPHGDGPIFLQDHSNKVSFRNIWIREL